MKNKLVILLLLLTAAITVFVAGCTTETRNITEPVENPIQTIKATGQITGRVINTSTQEPIPNAAVSISFNGNTTNVKSDEMGHFSISNVPVTEYRTLNGQNVASGVYPITLSLTEVNKTQSDSTRYRDYYYRNMNLVFTSIKSGGDSLTIENFVSSIEFKIAYLNTSLSGKVVDEQNEPAPNSVIYLYDKSSFTEDLIGSTTTNEEGVFNFDKIENGLLIDVKAVSSDGLMEAKLSSPFKFDPKINNYVLRPEVNAERLELKPSDNTQPKVLLITPEFNSDILSSSDLKITYTFSEPIKQTSYTKTDVPKGLNTMIDEINLTYDGIKKTNGSVSCKLSWENNFTRLIITPLELLTSGKYTLDVRFAIAKFKDNANNNIIDNPLIQGDLSEALKFTINQNSVVSTAPEISSTSKLNFNGGTFTVNWLNYSDPEAIYFNVYKSIDNQPFQMASSKIQALSYSDNTGPLVFPNINAPFKSISVRYKIHALSKDLIESSASNIIEARDVVEPEAAVDTFTVTTAQVLNDTLNYSLRLSFNEPLNGSDIVNLENYFLTNNSGVNILKVEANNAGNISGNYNVELKISTDRRLRGTNIFSIKCSGLRDLAGNLIKDSKSLFKFKGPF